MRLTLANGLIVEGEFLYYRIDPKTIPANRQIFELRHGDENEDEPASLKRGTVVVNFFGTFICEPIESILTREEIDIVLWEGEV